MAWRLVQALTTGAREFARFGHTARLIAPKFVTPYRLSGKKGKNDAADARAICEAVSRPNMRFVPIKTLDQQGQLLIHRARQGFVEQRTATLNRIRGLLSEFGIVLPLKAAVVRREALQHLEDLPHDDDLHACDQGKHRRHGESAGCTGCVVNLSLCF